MLSPRGSCPPHSFLTPCLGSLGKTEQDASSVATANFAVSCVAALVITVISGYCGRYPAVVGSSLVLTFAVIFAVFSDTFTTLELSLAIAGVGQGALMVAQCLAAEIAPPSQRGGYLNVINWVWSSTTVLVAAVGWAIFGSGGSYRAFLAASVWPLVLGALLALFTLLESPYWLAANGRSDEAQGVLLKMARGNHVDESRAQLQLPAPPAPGGKGCLGCAGGGGGEDARSQGAKAAPTRSLSEALGVAGLRLISRSSSLRLQTALHWLEWLIGETARARGV